MPEQAQWQVQPQYNLPEWFLQVVRQHAAGTGVEYIAQLLWQRQIRDPQQIAGFLNSAKYQPTSPFAFGEEMDWAVVRLREAWEQQEAIAIWGDFDADGITATAVLWEGLGQLFPQNERLTYTIPNRLTESHGLSLSSIQSLIEQGCRLVVTCDTGSTNLKEIAYAQANGLDVIITDHHTLPSDRPPVTAIINPRALPSEHPLATLSGVAVAYKLIEALYEKLPHAFQQPIETLLDLVAIGLIADLVELRGDCRYLAQQGIARLQLNQNSQTAPRPGVAKLLELCKRSGDRPTDISFGIGPRINAISRIHGDARFAVELLTSQDGDRCTELAIETELANARRKALQKDVAQQVKVKLAQTDLSTTQVIVLEDPQWSTGVLGLVAGQMAQEYGRPTILLSSAPTSELAPRSPEAELVPVARGSARSVNQIDLYQLVSQQAHLLQSFGGHPFAAGLSLPLQNISLFADAINRELRQQQFLAGEAAGPVIQADLQVTVAELAQEGGKALFRQLKLLEPCGMGNPVPKLMIQNCWFERIWNRNIKDMRGQQIRYIKTEFEILDETGARFPGIWWGHYKDDIPRSMRCDVIAELDYNAYQNRYEIRLVDLRATAAIETAPTASVNWLLDWRSLSPAERLPADNILPMTQCPSSWDELQVWFRRALNEKKQLAIAYSAPSTEPAVEVWRRLAGIAKYLSRTQATVTRTLLLDKLGVGDRTLQLGFAALKQLGFEITSSDAGFHLRWQPVAGAEGLDQSTQATHAFWAAVEEEQFRRQYFYHVPFATLQAAAQQIL